MLVSKDCKKPWLSLRMPESVGYSQDAFTGSVTINFRFEKSRIRVQIEHDELPDLIRWLEKCRSRAPMIQEV